MELIELLKKPLLFSGLNDADLSELATITVRRKFRKGESLFSAGDDANGFYLLVSGSIKLCRIPAQNWFHGADEPQSQFYIESGRVAFHDAASVCPTNRRVVFC